MTRRNVPGPGRTHPGKLSYAELERQVRILKAHEREREESWAGPQDAEGVALRPAITVLQYKNWTVVTRLIDVLPEAKDWQPRDENGQPIEGTHPIGFRGAVEFAQVHVGAAIDSIWFHEAHHPTQVRDYHRAKMWLTEPLVYQLLRRDDAGFQERLRFKRTVEALGLAYSMKHAFSVSKETVVEPVEAERKGYQ